MALLKQNPGKTLYPDIEWSKPENSNLLGKLLIIGGSGHSIAAPSTAYQIASNFGASNVKVIVPEAAKKNIPITLPFLEFAESNHSGSFSKRSTVYIKSFVASSDCTFFCGNFGKNSETAILIEDIIAGAKGLISVSGDAVDYFMLSPNKILSRDNSIVVASFAQLQKMAKNSPFNEAFLFSDGINATAQKLEKFLKDTKCIIITEKDGTLFLASNQNVLVTKFNKLPEDWQISTASLASCWAMFNSNNMFEACATAIANVQI